MTLTTLEYNGTEQTLGDWDIPAFQRIPANQAGDNCAFEMQLATDAADPFPYGALLILRTGRTPSRANPLNASEPPSNTDGGATLTFSGGAIAFVGYRVDTLRRQNGLDESFSFKIAGMWDFWFERTKFKKLFVTYNGVNAVVDFRAQVVLGMSLVSLYGPNDTVTGSAGTNLMSIRQQIIEIVQYAMNISALANGGTSFGSGGTAQFQFDANTSDGSGNYYLLNKTISAMISAGTYACLIPDYLPNMASPPGSPETSAAANLNTVLRAPLQAFNEITCGDAMRYMLRNLGIGDPVAWWDYSTCAFSGATMTAGPTLRVTTRDQLPSITLPFTGQQENFQIKARNDLLPTAVHMQYRIIGGGAGSGQIVNDIATYISGTLTEGIGLTGLLQSPAHFLAADTTYLSSGTQTTLQNVALLPATSGACINMQGGQTLSGTITCVTAYTGDPTGESSGGNEYDFWTSIFPDLAKAGSLAFYDATHAPATIVANDGSGAVSLTDYPYVCIDGTPAPWMSPISGSQKIKACTITGTFKYSGSANDGSANVNISQVSQHVKTAPILMTNLPNGSYSQSVAGEQIPYGLAGFLLAIWSILQYEGEYTLQETEITDQCPLGNNLNLSGGRTEWASMNACVQSIVYDYVAGTTKLTFGPAGHLGAKDFAERDRANYGDRWLYSIGGNLTNAAGANGSLGSNVAKSGTSPANPILNVSVQPQSLSDFITNASSYTAGIPGVTHDSVGSTNYAGISTAGSAPYFPPCSHWAAGSGGTVNSYVHIDAGGLITLKISSGTYNGLIFQFKPGDIPSGFMSNSSGDYSIKMREEAVCVDGSTNYRQFMCSAVYDTSLGNS